MARRAAIAYLGAALAFGALDFAWLSATNARLYRPALGTLLTAGFRPLPALLFYGLYVLGLTTFAIVPALRAGRWTTAPRLGALFGLVAYATYDLTNQATLVHWSTTVTLCDLAWGAFNSAMAASVGYFAAARFAGSKS